MLQICVAALLAIGLSVPALHAQTAITAGSQALLAGWDFDNILSTTLPSSPVRPRYSDVFGNNSSPTALTAPGGIYFNGTFGSDSWGTVSKNSTGDISRDIYTRAGSGSTFDLGGQTGGEGAANFNNANVGTAGMNEFSINVHTSDGVNSFRDLSLSLWGRDPANQGSATINWFYSIDGGVTKVSTGLSSVFSSNVFTESLLDLSSISALDNLADIYLIGQVVESAAGVQLNLDNIGVYAFAYQVGPTRLTFWQGGDGVWTKADSPTNWRDSVGGSTQGAWQNGGVATLGGTAGTVTVDDADGDVEISGIKFVVSGYTVTGDPLVAKVAETIIQVGDETAGSAAMTATINSIITGTGGIQKTDLGTLVLTGTNDYTGDTVVTAGTLSIGNGGTTGSITGNIASDGVVVFNRSDDLTYAGAMLSSGTGTVTKLGVGKLTLAGENTYTGTTTVTAGTLQIGDGATAGSLVGNLANNAAVIFNRSDASAYVGDISGSGSVTKQGTGTLTLTGASDHSGGTTVSAGTLSIGDGGATGSVAGDITNNATLTFNRSGTVSYAGVISGSGGIVKQGSGELTLTGTSTYTGGTTIDAGTLVVGGDLTGAAGGFVVGTGANLSIGDGATAGGIVGGITNGGGVTFNRSDAVTYTGIISGDGAVTKQGGGVLTLTGANTYTGGTTVTAGTLQIGTGATAGSIAGDLTNNAAVVFNRSDDLTYAGDIGGSGMMTKQGTGTLTLTGDSTQTGGILVSEGALQIGAAGTAGSVAGNISNETAVIFNRSDAVTYAGIVSGAGTVIKQGGGTLTLTGANTHAGGTIVDEGTLSIGAGGTVGSLSGDMAIATTVIFNRSNEVTYNGAISGDGAVIKQGAGTLTLGGANTYTGATTVSDGTLLIDGDQSAATGAATVAAGASLGGGGTHGGIVNVQADGTLIGESGSVLTLGGLTLSANSRVAVTLAGSTSTTTLFDITGNLTLDGILDISPGTGFTEGVFRLFDVGGTLLDNGMAIGAVPGSANDFAMQVDSLAGTVDVDFSAGTRNYWQGGAGTWTAAAAGTAWKNFLGSSSGAWVGPEFAVFSATPGGTVTVDDADGDVEITGIQFATTGYTIAGDALTNDEAAAEFRVGNGSGGDAAMTATISAPIEGAGGVNKTFAGTLVLSGTNTYAGLTTVTGGKLVIAGNNTGAAGGISVGTGATLAVGAGGSTGQMAGAITNAGTVIFDRSDSSGFAGAISGGGSLTKQGGGTLTLTGASTYTGGTAVTAGTLNIGGGGASGSLTGNITANAGATVAFDRSDSALTYAGIVSGDGALAKQGTGTVTLTGASSHKGGTAVSAGTLVVTGDLTAATGAMTVASGATLALGTGGTTGIVAGNIADNGTVVFNRSDAPTYAGILSGGGTLSKQGGGTLTLTGANTYTGATTVSGGTLLINGAQTAAAGTVTVATGATLGGSGTHGGAVTVQSGGTLSGATATKFTLGSLTLQAGSNLSITLGAPSSVELFKVNGNLTLDGTLNVNAGAGLAEGLTRLFSYSGTLTNNILDIGSVVGDPLAYTIQTGTANRVNLMYSPSTVPVTWIGGSGTWSSATSATGWGDANGKWSPAFAIFDGNPGTVTVASTEVNPVVLTGIQFAVDQYAVDGTTIITNTANTVFRVGDGTADGVDMTATISAPIAGSGGVDKTDLGTLVLSGTNTYEGGTRITSGVLQVSSDAALGATTGGLRFNGGTLRAGSHLTTARSVVLSAGGGTLDSGTNTVAITGLVSGSGALTKQGSGTVTLAGANTYSGATSVNAGTLLINGNQAGASGSIAVAAGGALGGAGTHGGAVNIASGGTLLGASGGTLTMGALTLNQSSFVNVALGAPAPTALFQVNGNLTLDGILNITAAPSFGEGLYRLFSYTGGLTNNALQYGTTPALAPATSFSLQTSVAQQVNLLYTQAPIVWEDNVTTLSATTVPGLIIFQGGGGDITVDDVVGPVVVKGVQFAAGDYHITGDDALTINTTNAALRVGDGTAAGAALTGRISAPINGTGGVDKTDLGTLVLTGANGYTGGTRVSGGVLEISSDTALGAAGGAVRLNGGTLRAGAGLTSARSVTVTAASTIDTGASNVALTGIIGGTGALTKRGTGSLTVSGANTITGATTISEGTVILNASSLGATTVAAGARLGGVGTIRGNLTNSGTLSPGASPGTITIMGNLTQSAGGTYAVELASATSYDNLVVSGTATLGGTLSLSGLGGFVPGTGQTFKIIEAAGGVTGTFANVVSPWDQVSIMRRFQAIYGANAVSVGFLQLPFAGVAGGTANQQAVGGAVDGAIADGTIPTLSAALNGISTEAGVLAALDQLSPQRHERWYEQAVYSAVATMRMAENHMAARAGAKKRDDEGQGGLWLEMVRRETRFDAIEAEGSARARGTADGIVVGGDIPVSPQWQLGVLFGYTDENLELDGAGSSTAVERFNAAVYARLNTTLFLEAVAGMNYAKLGNRRMVAVGATPAVAESTVDSGERYLGLRTGLPLKFGAARLTPYMAMNYVRWTADAATESGAGEASLDLASQSASSLSSRTGLALAWPFGGKKVTVTPRFDLAWWHEFRADPRTLSAELGGNLFSVQTRTPSENGMTAGFGLDAAFGSRFSAYARFASEWTTTVDEALEARAGVDFRF